MSVDKEKLTYIDTNLVSISYEHFQGKEPSTLVNKATVSVGTHDDNMVCVRVSIESTWEPEGPFTLSVTFKIYYGADELPKQSDITSEDIEWMIGPAQRHYSMILANLTQLSSDIPFIWIPKGIQNVECITRED